MKALATAATVDKNLIIAAAIRGTSIREIAEFCQCSTTVVRNVLDEYATETLTPSSRAAMLALEIQRLEKLESVFLEHAITNLDSQAGTLAVKVSQRRAALCGLDQPIEARLDVTVMERRSPRETSTDRLLRVIEELKSGHKPECIEHQPDPTQC